MRLISLFLTLKFWDQTRHFSLFSAEIEDVLVNPLTDYIQIELRKCFKLFFLHVLLTKLVLSQSLNLNII